jgi:hypothetical protein
MSNRYCRVFVFARVSRGFVRCELGFVVFLLLFSNGLSSQNISVPVPSQIEGVVTDGETDAGIESATVRLEKASSNGLVDETTTGKDGRFAFTDVSAGEYRVRSAKSGYQEFLLGENADRSILVSGRQRVTVRLSLIRSCVVTGQVFDAFGQPVRSGKVIALSRRTIGGVATLLVERRNAQLDDQGEFRLFDLSPGFYTFALVPSGEPNVTRLPPIYSPGVAASSQADFIELHPGDSRTDVQISIPTTETEVVKGVISGIPNDWGKGTVAVSLLPVDGVPIVIQSVIAGSDGRFSFPAVPVGTYRLFAYGPTVARGPFGPIAGENSKQGSAEIEVSGARPPDAMISLSNGVGLEVNGVWEPTSNQNSLCYANAEVHLRALDPMPPVKSAFVASFSKQYALINDVPKGRYTADLSNLNSSCFVQDVSFESQRGAVINVTGPGKLTFILSGHSGSVTGTVVGDDGSAKAKASVILIPSQEPETLAVPTRTTLSDEKGLFHLDYIAPGHYRILAVVHPVSDAYLDPLFWVTHQIPEILVKPGATLNSRLKVTR